MTFIPRLLGMAIFFLLATITVNGCGGSDAMRTYYNFSNAVMDQNYDKAKTYCTARFVKKTHLVRGGIEMGLTLSTVGTIKTPEELKPSYKEFTHWLKVTVKGGIAYIEDTSGSGGQKW